MLAGAVTLSLTTADPADDAFSLDVSLGGMIKVRLDVPSLGDR